MSAPSPIQCEVFAVTDTGLIRSQNQDYFLVGDLEQGERLSFSDSSVSVACGPAGLLWVVCDGMGGAAGGEIASKLAAEMVWEVMGESPRSEVSNEVYGRLLRRAVRMACRRVWEESRRNTTLRGMGTTLSAAGLSGSSLIFAQVGDSRAYVLRRSQLVQATRDQSIAAALMRSGIVTPEQARALPHANVILQALGVRSDVEVSISVVALRRGDMLLLCSDGLHGGVNDESIRAILTSSQDLAEIGTELVKAAYDSGGSDNITAVLVRFGGDSLEEPRDDADLPQFAEMDPRDEGERALTDTSRVVRRLAAKAGLGDGPPEPPVVPETAQHPVIPRFRDKDRARAGAQKKGRDKARDPGAGAGGSAGDGDVRAQVKGQGNLEGPAALALAEGSRVSMGVWIIAAALVIAAILVVVLGLL